MKHAPSILTLLFSFLFAAGAAWAEGNCPDGMYPIGGQGAQGCAPISSNGDEGYYEPRYQPRWHAMYGAIAIDGANHQWGATSNSKSQGGAEAGALETCSAGGKYQCRIDSWYSNQCVALAWPLSPGSLIVTDYGATADLATQKAMARCESGSKEGCKLEYSECSRAALW